MFIGGTGKGEDSTVGSKPPRFKGCDRKASSREYCKWLTSSMAMNKR
jgi:hypothetical protein